MQNKTAGLFRKFKVERTSDPEEKHDNCRYFVLDPQHDSLARISLVGYSRIARDNGFIALADDIDAWLEEIYKDES